jgi:hypothetical protein
MKLELYRRPVVLFDPSNAEHRRDYAGFLSTGSWRGCDVRYVIDDSAGDLQARIQRSLLEYYVAREFVAEKQQ